MNDLSDAYKLEVLLISIHRAMSRYNNPKEKHNIYGGMPRGYIASAMESDLEEGLKWIGVKTPEMPKPNVEVDRLF